MAMTVRFPCDGAWILKDEKDGEPIAFIQSSAGAIVEFEDPCAVYDALQKQQLEELIKEVRALKRKLTRGRK